MQKLIIRFILLACISVISSCCSLFNLSAARIYRKYAPEIHYSMTSAQTTQKKDLLFLVFPDGDSAAFDSTIEQIFELDRNCDDAMYYQTICEEFAVVKIYRSTLDVMVADTIAYPRFLNSSVPAKMDTLNRSKSCMFIGGKEYLDLYGLQYFSAPKSWKTGLIWVKYGP